MKVIQVENLSKTYDLGLVGTGTLSKDLNRAWARMRGKPDPYATLAELNDRTQKSESGTVYALKDINFSVEQGEVLGIIGKNGAGKSTLLKILSQITSPSSGNIKIKGRVASLLEVGTGMHPEMTARQNIYLNGSIMGMRRHEITRKLDEIIDFAGIAKYVDTPIKRFSSGMQVRLGFAVAAFLEPEILIVDEVLAVGDAEFQKKAIGKMQDVSKGEGRTVLFVSHNLSAVQALCNKGVYLENGKLLQTDEIKQIIYLYRTLKKDFSTKYFSNKSLNENQELGFESIQVFNRQMIECSQFMCDEDILIEFKFQISSLHRKYNLFVTVKDKNGVPVFSAERVIDRTKITLRIKSNFLTRGHYSLQTFIHIPTIFQLEALDDVCHFSILDINSSFVIHGDYNYGNVFGQYEWIEGNLLR